MSDANKKTTRSFQCRDALWEKFEQMARELECSIDYLINDSMKQYLRQRGYGSTAASMSMAPGAAGGPPSPSAVAAHRLRRHRRHHLLRRHDRRLRHRHRRHRRHQPAAPARPGNCRRCRPPRAVAQLVADRRRRPPRAR